APAPAPPAPQDDVASVDDLDDLDALLDLANERRDLAAMRAAWRRFDVLAEAAEPTTLQKVRRLDARGFEHAVDGEGEDAVTCWKESARLFGTLGDEVRRHRALARLGAMRAQLGDTGGLDEMAAAADYFAQHPTDDGDATGSLIRLATVQAELGSHAGAIAALDRIVPDDAPDRAGEAWFVRGNVLLMTGDPDAAVTALRRSVEAARTSDDPMETASPALLLARTLARQESGPDEETFALLDEVLGVLPGASPMRAAAHAERGLALLTADRAADAVADLVEGIAAWTAQGAHEQAVHLRVDLAAAYLSTGRHLEAAEAAEEALPALDDTQRCRLILAHAQKELGEEEAAAGFTALAEDAAQDGRHDAVAHFLEEAGGVLTGLDMDALAAERFAEAAEAHEKAGDPYGVVRTRRRAAMCLLWTGDADQAATTMDTARAALAGLPPDNEPARIWETALVSYDQARLLAQTGDLSAAASNATAAADGFTTLNETDAAEEATRLHAEIKEALS
ncbi:hypothetical protein E1293_33400, partial [Actinomadura darangshiensis]